MTSQVNAAAPKQQQQILQAAPQTLLRPRQQVVTSPGVPSQIPAGMVLVRTSGGQLAYLRQEAVQAAVVPQPVVVGGQKGGVDNSTVNESKALSSCVGRRTIAHVVSFTALFAAHITGAAAICSAARRHDEQRRP